MAIETKIEEISSDSSIMTDSATTIRDISVNPHVAELSAEAKDATQHEHSLSLLQALKLYPKAVGWSILLSTAVIMEGYDVVLLPSFYAMPEFNRKYGILEADGSYTVPASWKSGLSNGVLCGEIIGLFINGIVSERYGYKKTMIASLMMMIGAIFIPFFSQNIETLLVGSIICGIPWGVFQTLTTAYASEVCPTQLRAYLCTYVNLCWVMGQFIASGILRAMLNRNDEWQFRIPFALQWLWPAPILLGVIFAPESPWWLIRKGRIEDAKKSLLRLTTRVDENFSVDDTVAMMSHTNELEKSVSSGTSYLDCFRGTDRRRTEIACMTWLVQTLCGSTFMGYSTYFYQQAGLPTVQSFNLSMAQYALGALGTMGAWWLMSCAGRRTIYLRGSCILCILLLIIGFTSLAPESNMASRWAIGSMLLVFTFIYDLTVGPVCYALVAEVSSTRLRSKTIVLARNFYNVGGIVVNILTTYQLTPKPTGWGWGAGSAFFWAGTCFLCILWIFFRLPEPKDRTYAEMDVLFEKRISARKFRDTKLDIFAPAHDKTSNREESDDEKPVENFVEKI
ncbi:sugar porter family MFS transporter [Phlyctema vagabunda]|uniref:Sugar porter family MFS transporter n=1 Tax=Phlyctema vagabunda TaxID=108571 RepID=A0ABR4P536_9HELO